jgi:hypothetical protein
MPTTLCLSCTEGPHAEAGHRHLSFYVEGPFPGHRIFRCGSCDARWIRHYGSEDVRFAWTRYSEELRMYLPRSGGVPLRPNRPTSLPL